MTGYSVVALHRPKSNLNVGSVLRIAHNYGVSLVVTSGIRYKHARTDVPKTDRRIPVLCNLDDLFDALPYNAEPVAVDIVAGATSLPEFNHPRRAFYIFGPEDGTLDGDLLERCHRRVYVPTTNCMNLAVTVGVVLYDRMAKGAYL